VLPHTKILFSSGPKKERFVSSVSFTGFQVPIPTHTEMGSVIKVPPLQLSAQELVPDSFASILGRDANQMTSLRPLLP
jgi:hypothetical protein